MIRLGVDADSGADTSDRCLTCGGWQEPPSCTGHLDVAPRGWGDTQGHWHSSQSLAEIERKAGAPYKSVLRTYLLDVSYIWGDASLVSELSSPELEGNPRWMRTDGQVFGQETS